MRLYLRYASSILFAACALVTNCLPLHAQSPAPAPVTAILATLTVKGEDRAAAMKILPDEVRATVKLYLEGKIQQWYARGDGKGVVFVMSCNTVADAKALTDTLPLSKANLATFEYMELSPLTPLRLLIAEPAKQ